MKYIQLIEQARTTGVANESKMNVAIAQMSCDLESVKNEKPNLFWKIMRHQHAVLYDRHYSEKFANHDVNCLEYGEPDEEGIAHPAWRTLDALTDHGSYTRSQISSKGKRLGQICRLQCHVCRPMR